MDPDEVARLVHLAYSLSESFVDGFIARPEFVNGGILVGNVLPEQVMEKGPERYCMSV